MGDDDALSTRSLTRGTGVSPVIWVPAPGLEGKEHAIVTATVRNKAREVVGSSGEYGVVSAVPLGILSIKQENVAKADKVFVAVGRNLVYGSSLVIPAHVRE